MVELAAYCSNNSSLSSSVVSGPVPGAACCAQFSGEDFWTLSAGENLTAQAVSLPLTVK